MAYIYNLQILERMLGAIERVPPQTFSLSSYLPFISHTSSPF